MSGRHATVIVSPQAIEQAAVDILRLAVVDAREAAGLGDAGPGEYEVHVTVVEVRRRPSLRPVPDLGGEAA